jgi:hypothetical protein
MGLKKMLGLEKSSNTSVKKVGTIFRIGFEDPTFLNLSVTFIKLDIYQFLFS